MNTLKKLIILATAVFIFGCGEQLQTDRTSVLRHYQNRAGEVVYSNSFDDPIDMFNWVIEGPGRVRLQDGWMIMDSPEMEGHFVHWIDAIMPENFIVEFDFQVLSDDGLCILFICATGEEGQSIFDTSLAPRDGHFVEYINGDINNYLLQYYTQNPTHLDHTYNELCKNPGFELLDESPKVITRGSTDIYRITVIKDGARIRMLVDDIVIIDAVDDNALDKPPYGRGYMGFRQMKWTAARYSNLVVTKLN